MSNTKSSNVLDSSRALDSSNAITSETIQTTANEQASKSTVRIPDTSFDIRTVRRYVQVPSKYIYLSTSNYNINAVMLSFDIEAVKLFATVGSVTKTTGVHATIFVSKDTIPDDVMDGLRKSVDAFLSRETIDIEFSGWGQRSDKIHGELADAIKQWRLDYYYVDDQRIPHIELRK